MKNFTFAYNYNHPPDRFDIKTYIKGTPLLPLQY